MSNTSCVPVIAAVIERAGAYLICQRPLDKRHGGLWEFPGGKLLDGESPLEGASRELWEELELEVQTVGNPLLSLQDPNSDFLISFCPVEALGEQAIGFDHDFWIRGFHREDDIVVVVASADVDEFEGGFHHAERGVSETVHNAV